MLKNPKINLNMNHAPKIGFLPYQKISTIDPGTLQIAMSQYKHCTIIAGSMHEFNDRLNANAMGIEMTRGDGFRFNGKTELFSYHEFEVRKKKYLRFGLSNHLEFAQPIEDNHLICVVLKQDPEMQQDKPTGTAICCLHCRRTLALD